jgi:hypothetical protein
MFNSFLNLFLIVCNNSSINKINKNLILKVAAMFKKRQIKKKILFIFVNTNSIQKFNC